MKLSTLVGSEESLVKLMALKMPMSVSYKLSKLVFRMQPDLKIWNEKRLELFKEYGTLDEKTDQYTVKPENIVKFQEELTKLLEVEVDLTFAPEKPFEKISVAEFGDAQIEPSVLLQLEWLLSD